MKMLPVALALMIALCGCLEPQEPESKTVEYGDNVSVYYTLRTDGEIYQTNNETLARQEGIHNPSMNYGQLVFKAVLGEGLLDAFVQNVVGMEEGQTKQFNISPSNGYGREDPSLIYNTSLYYERDMTEVVPVSYFNERDIEIKEGESFDTDIGTVFISSFNDTHANLTYVFQQGDIFYYMGLPQEVTESKDGVYTIKLDVVEDGRYTTISPVSGKVIQTTVMNITNDTIVFNENHQLAGKTLDYTVTVSDVEKE